MLINLIESFCNVHIDQNITLYSINTQDYLLIKNKKLKELVSEHPDLMFKITADKRGLKLSRYDLLIIGILIRE